MSLKCVMKVVILFVWIFPSFHKGFPSSPLYLSEQPGHLGEGAGGCGCKRGRGLEKKYQDEGGRVCMVRNVWTRAQQSWKQE